MPQQPASSPEHGYCQVERQANIIRISVAEGINKELILRYQQEIARELTALGGGHWGVHLVINGDVLMTPEATERLILETSRHVALGRCGTAIELVNGRATSLIQRFWGATLPAGRHSLLLRQQPARGRDMVTATDCDG